MAARGLKASALRAQLPEGVLAVWERLGSAGACYLVGGAVRDLLVGRRPRDYDLATALAPEAARRLLGWPEGFGGRFGSLRAPGLPLEIVSMRSEAGYRDRRRPDAVRFGAGLAADLARRDFTVNAMALGRDGELIDPFCGARDLLHARIAAVGDARARLSEDLLRILRAYRLAAELEFTVAPGLRAAARELAPELGVLARERVGQELWRLLEAPGALRAARWALRDGVLAAVLPWLEPTRQVPGPVPRLLAWSQDAPVEDILRQAEMYAWPRHARRLLAAALALRGRVTASGARSAWREALAEAGHEAADILVIVGGGERLQRLARLYGREGVLDRRRLPLRGLDLAAARGAEPRSIGALERAELQRLWRDPRSVL